MDPEWEVVRSGIEPGVSEVVIREGVYPAMDYQFRVTVFTSVFSTVSQPSPMFTTPHTGEWEGGREGRGGEGRGEEGGW